VEVWHKGEPAPTLARTVVDDDGAGLRDGDRAPGDNAADPVQSYRGQRRIVPHQLGVRRKPCHPFGGQAIRYEDGRDSADRGGDRRLDIRRGDAPDDREVVGGAFGEQGDDIGRGRVVVRPPVRPRQRRVGGPVTPAGPGLALVGLEQDPGACQGAGRGTPLAIKVRSRARSSSDRTTTCCLRMLGSSAARSSAAKSMCRTLASRKSRLTGY